TKKNKSSFTKNQQKSIKPPQNPFIYRRQSRRNPFWSLLSFQEMIKKLLLTDLYVFPIPPFHYIMCVIIVIQHPAGLSHTTKCHKHFNALVPRHGTIVIIGHNRYGWLNAIHIEQR